MAKQSYYDALTLINGLLKELKRLDDKLVLVEVQLLESKVYHALGVYFTSDIHPSNRSISLTFFPR